MKTVLPYANLAVCAYVLDDRTLERQRIEVQQLIGVLRDGRQDRAEGARMWDGHVAMLALHCSVLIREWRRRGNAETMVEPFAADGARGIAHHVRDLLPATAAEARVPDWMGDEAIHSAHRGWLLATRPDDYARWGWTDAPRHEFPHALGRSASPAPALS